MSRRCHAAVVELTGEWSSYLVLRDALVSHASGRVNCESGRVMGRGVVLLYLYPTQII